MEYILVLFQVFLLLVQDKLEELGIPCDVASVISDFELNILKSVDDILGVDIEGCFFHFSKCLKTKVDKKHFKNRYENAPHFQSFVKECGALAHLPLDDLENGLEHIENKLSFDDEEANDVKVYFLRYIKEFGIDGSYPPQVWN